LNGAASSLGNYVNAKAHLIGAAANAEANKLRRAGQVLASLGDEPVKDDKACCRG